MIIMQYNILIFLLAVGLLAAPHQYNNVIRNNNDPHRIDIKIKRDSLGRKATLYLDIQGMLVDSVSIVDIDFRFDSLVQLNDTVWKYIYSLGYDKRNSSIIYARQLLLEELNNKIHFSLVSDYGYWSNAKVDSVFEYSIKKEYRLCLNDSIPNIKLFSSTKDVIIIDDVARLDSLTSIVYLKYDSCKKIYFNSIDVLDGNYKFLPKEPEARKYESGIDIFIDNEEVKTIKIGKSHYIYMNNNWFIVQTFPYHTKIISFLPIENTAKKK